MLRLEGSLAVVVGCGGVGMRKVRELLDAGAAVRLVCGDDDPGTADGAELIREPYRPAFLDGAAVVFACTDDSTLNSRIAEDARSAGALANAVDQPDDCDFFSPAVLRDGDMVVAVGSGNAAPGLAGSVKRYIGDTLPAGLGEFAALLREFREELKGSIADPSRRMAVMRDSATWDMFGTYRRGGRNAVRGALDALLSGETPAVSVRGTTRHERPAEGHRLLIGCVAVTAVIFALWAVIYYGDPGMLYAGHVAGAFLSFLSLGISAWTAVRFLKTEMALKHRDASLLSRRAPSLEKLDRICRTALTYGFFCFTVAIGFGVLCALTVETERWLSDWTTHPKVTAAFVGWGICLAAVAAAWAPRFRGRRTAVLGIAGFLLVFLVMAISFLLVD